jgi:hypothetical protein
MGRLSKFWENAYVAYLGRSVTQEAALRWSVFLTTSLWEYTGQIWKTRNEYVHGTASEQAIRILTEMEGTIISLCEEFAENPNMLLPHHHHLFTRLSVTDRLKQGYDDIQCWLRSVEEAWEVLQHHKDVLRNESAWFFITVDKNPTSTALSVSSSPVMKRTNLTTSTVSYPRILSPASSESDSLASAVTSPNFESGHSQVYSGCTDPGTSFVPVPHVTALLNLPSPSLDSNRSSPNYSIVSRLTQHSQTEEILKFPHQDKLPR